MIKRFLIFGLLLFAGCQHDGTQDWCAAEIRQLKTQRLGDLDQVRDLEARIEKLEKLQPKRIGRPAGAQAESALPNIHAALGHGLLAAADIAGRDQVGQFFRAEVGKIVARHFPVDLGGAIKSKCEDDMAATINSLMDNP